MPVTKPVIKPGDEGKAYPHYYVDFTQFTKYDNPDTDEDFTDEYY